MHYREMSRNERYDWTYLPDACFEAILTNLPLKDAASCRLVCRSWLAQASSTIVSLVPQETSSVQRVVKAFPALKCLSLIPLNGASDPVCLLPLSGLRSLTDLSLDRGDYAFGRHSLILDLGREQLLQLSALPCLASLTLHGLCLHLTPELRLLSPNLKSLHLSSVKFPVEGCPVVDFNPLTVLGSLESLTIYRPMIMRRLGQTTAMFSSVGSMSSLRSLSIRDCIELCNSVCEKISSMPRLESLELVSLGYGTESTISDKGFAALRAMRSTLVSLKLSGWFRLCNECVKQIGVLTELTSLQLDGFDAAELIPPGSDRLEGDSSLSDAGSRWLADLTNLQSLSLRRWPVGSETCRVVSSLPHLTRLELPVACCLTNSFLYSISKVPLRHLNLRHCSRITNLGICAIAKGCQQLTHLDLAAVSHVTNAGIRALHTLKKLSFLNVSAGLVGDAGLLGLLPSLPGLQYLNCSDTVITDAVCEMLAGHCPELRELNVEHCVAVSDRGAVALYGLRHLDRVSAFGSNISKAGAESLRTSTGAAVGHDKMCWWGKGGKINS